MNTFRCEQCRCKTDRLRDYGGIKICDYCYDKYNPEVSYLYRLTDKQREERQKQIVKLKKEISKIEYELNRDDDFMAKGYEIDQPIACTSSVYHAYIKNQKNE